MGVRITNGINPGLLLVEIFMFLIFAICIHSGANVCIELLRDALQFHVWK